LARAVVPELTCSAGIKLNMRLRLARSVPIVSSSGSGATEATSGGDLLARQAGVSAGCNNLVSSMVSPAMGGRGQTRHDNS
jgi:hypothetical protein